MWMVGNTTQTAWRTESNCLTGYNYSDFYLFPNLSPLLCHSILKFNQSHLKDAAWWLPRKPHTFPDISGNSVKFIMLKTAALYWEIHMIINPLGLLLQITFAIKKIFGFLGQRLKAAQGLLLSTLQSSKWQKFICGLSNPIPFLITSSG